MRIFSEWGDVLRIFRECKVPKSHSVEWCAEEPFSEMGSAVAHIPLHWFCTFRSVSGVTAQREVGIRVFSLSAIPFPDVGTKFKPSVSGKRKISELRCCCADHRLMAREETPTSDAVVQTIG